MQLEIRKFGKGDIPFAVGITDREGWYLTEYDLSFYTGGGGTGVVALLEGERIGMATAAIYERSAWIGNVVVDARLRGGGAGRSIVEDLMERLKVAGAGTVLLYAYDRSRTLYERMGFKFDSVLWEVTADIPRGASGRFRQGLTEGVYALDASIFHASRRSVLEHVSGREGCTVLSSGADGTDAFLLCSPGGAEYGTEVAPFIAAGATVRQMLSALEGMPGPLHMYVPEGNIRILEREGVGCRLVRRIHRGYIGDAAVLPSLGDSVISAGFLESG